MGLLQEFRDFALKSNFIDMATGIVIGGAVGTVVKSLVEDIIMPPIGMMLNGVDFSELKLTLKSATADAPAVAINYGSFINSLISFAIIAFAIFMIIKAYNTAKTRFEKEQAAAPAVPPRSEVLLQEIRDALVKR
ncbi:MAG: large-conductance mechanosensitive channel protein MscL [Rhizobiales bacterium]|nr:large-conductance mechanosensitive channel protein MscL [Hyphomicrobiales bacterium]